MSFQDVHVRAQQTCFYLDLKGRVVHASLPAAQASAFTSSGCVTDGTTALTEQMSRAVATPPTLPSVSACYL